jgi:glutamyl-tRNA synthetase
VSAPLPNVNVDCSRLAPSPTGALHLGNARTFLINWGLARQRGWRLILRIEDLDTPRVKAGAATGIMETLGWLGIDWDTPTGEVLVQSEDLEPYRGAMRSLAALGKVYPCALSRGEIEAAASAPQEGTHEMRFPAHLRAEVRAYDFDEVEAGSGDEGTNWRFVVPEGSVGFADRFAGAQSFDISGIVGDFGVWTKRRQPSYQLAVVVDDHRQGVTQVIRGADLLDSAARQLLLYRALGYEREPLYTHLPLVLGPDGKRLAKRHGDTRVDTYRRMGVPAEAVVGLVASWCVPGSEWGGGRQLMTSREFLDVLDLSRIAAQPIIFTPEDDEWLRSQARRV